MKHVKSSESAQRKLQNDRPSSDIDLARAKSEAPVNKFII